MAEDITEVENDDPDNPDFPNFTLEQELEMQLKREKENFMKRKEISTEKDYDKLLKKEMAVYESGEVRGEREYYKCMKNFQSVPHRKVSLLVLFFFFSFSLFYLALSELILITYFPPSTELSWDHPYSLLLVSMHSVTFYVVIKRANDIVNWLKSYKSQHRKNVVVTVKKRIR
ncbi:uncharacterized protein LOC111620241 [Centruroides sculpturatus]|uniref:uncharacterized protein LOC111620241 n=1 Tax=Centruroides sculpturatus TaxID=218467 RepID=UPI000C6DC7E9|nr:uncharacterized protein LOC111620241 [Centruroides sculpturatus]